jgi:plastocyanin
MWTRFSCGGVALVVALTTVACGGGGSSTPTSPSPSGGGAAAAGVTVSITASAGSQAFNPNPATIATTGTVAWANRDGAMHRIVANDGTFDTGDIVPGATSRTITPPAAGTNYHCTIHPTMIGAIAAQGQPPPPCTGPYCNE